MTNRICRVCGNPISPEDWTGDDICLPCLKEEKEELDFLEEEEEEEGDHYSFWKGCPMGRLWSPGWGPFGPRRRR